MKPLEFLIRFNANTAQVTRACDQIDGRIDRTVATAEKKVGGIGSTFKNMLGANIATMAISTALNGIRQFVEGSAEAWNVQALAEKKLETVMRQRMGATDEAIAHVKELASAQQQLGVIGDEVQLSGAQQMATFLNEQESIDKLVPAMNNLLAQQKGLNATQEDAVGIGNLIGKVMQGQTAALTRVGVTFTAAQEQVLKFGTEQERAAMLAQVITDNVGEMNAALASTPEGKLKQGANRFGDIQEQAGRVLQQVKAAFSPLASYLMSALEKVMPYLQKIVVPVQMAVGWLMQQMNALHTILQPIAGVFDTLKSSAGGLAEYITSVYNVVREHLMPLFNVLNETVGSIVSDIISFISSSELLHDVFSVIMKFVGKILDDIKALVKVLAWVWDNVAKPLFNAIEKAYVTMKNLLGLAGKKVTIKAKVQTPDGKTMGISTPGLLGSANGGSVTMGSQLASSGAGKKTAEAVATGGTRNTSVYVNIAKLIETMNTYMTESETKEDFYDRVVESMVRAVNIGVSAAR